ncbi:MAG: phosphoribosylformylglycinamidine synthase subunit PurL [Candidatus ainarchaeum sp.]|nr:phosphoribosylformylglycinamidine synthase subunit PurL [Candidatus ainarchaeum sp.]
MPCRIEVKTKDGFRDVAGEKAKTQIHEELGIKLEDVKIINTYNIYNELGNEELEKLGEQVFSDKITEEFNYKNSFYTEFWRIETGYLPGVTDNVGKTAIDAVRDALNKEIEIYHSKVYVFKSKGLEREIVENISKLFYNKLVEKAIIYKPFEERKIYLPKVVIRHEPEVQEIDIVKMSSVELSKLSEERLLALNEKEMDKIRKYLSGKRVLDGRKRVGLKDKITDVELECIAQTWSEHCKHKIFNSYIQYQDNGDSHAIDSVFNTFIKAATQQIKKPYVVSVFKDNGGIIKLNDQQDIAVKVETHNAPSALDPYGGSLTGILGVNRDVIGCGLGAKPVGNIDVLCFGELDQKDLPPGVLHPKKIFSGVIKGIEDGGNCSGIPTINGSIIFEKGYAARPLVYAGTVGVMPSEIDGRKTNEKKVENGYLAVMVGGRIGKDGIHGATFSSQQIDENTPQSVVQIGDPFTQKKVLDFILETRDKRLYEAITDNGAGGLSSSIGEMAEFSDGCEIYLDKAPLKYPGLDPWEILISESQERMLIAVPKENLEELEEIAKKHDVEITVVGTFTDSGKFHVMYGNKTVAYLDMKFLHGGVPQMKLRAVWKRKVFDEPKITQTDLSELIKMILASPNIASKEQVVRRYDHEVQGGSIIKPINRGPNNSGVIKPILESNNGLVVGHGICPRYVQDSYDMAAMAIDEAVRNVLASGAKFGYLACLDNFSWPNPLPSEQNPDAEYKLAQLVRACISLYDYALSYGIPIISGKDSMKNDYYYKGQKYSIPPTLLVTVIGKIDDVENAISSDFKNPGDSIYILGITRAEMGGSEYYKLFKGVGNSNPKVRDNETVPLYKKFSKACEEGLISSAHDVSDGGLAVSLSECSIGGNLGIDIDLGLVPRDTENEDEILFSESAGRFVVSVNDRNISKFEKTLEGIKFAKIGRVRGDKRLIIRRNERILVNEDVEILERIWKGKIKA